MLIWENIKLAFLSLSSNKMRSFLTMLGIIIGIGSVIAIMTVSSSLTTSISDTFQEMGANNITVGLSQKSSSEEVRENGMKFGAAGRNSSIEEKDRITQEMIDGLCEEYPDEIDAISISESVGSAEAERDGETADISLSGINKDYFKSNKLTLQAGRYITNADNKKNKKVIMVSDKLVDSLFDGNQQNALWQKISVNINNVYTNFYIVGIYKYESTGSISESSDDITTSAYIPLDVAKQMMRSDKGYTQFTIVTAAGLSDISGFSSKVESYFSTYYAKNEDYEISTSTLESMTESMSDMVNTVSMAIALIAGISLLVGGIGVMNIMLVSITERTREIGTRKALGATNGCIRLQFIIEAVILCLVGGCLGILIGLGLGALFASILGYSATAPVAAIFISVGFSMVIGVFFGFYPANKAAKLDPIAALRYGE